VLGAEAGAGEVAAEVVEAEVVETSGVSIGEVGDSAGVKVKETVGKVADKWSRAPETLQDEMVLEAAKNGAGKPIIKDLKDPKYKGMEKWEFKEKSAGGKDSVVHWVRDPKTGKTMDFKFKKHSNE
jgi:filamentous hemagglutinin